MMKNLYLLVVIILLTTCSFPKVVILEDTLTAEEHNDLGVIYLKQKKYELAEKEFLKAVKKKPKWDVLYFNLGNLYYCTGNYDKSEEFYRKAISLNEKNSDAMNNLAYVLSENCKKEEALEWVKKAISIQFKDEYLETLKSIENKQCNR